MFICFSLIFCMFQGNHGRGSSEPRQVSELGSQSAAAGQVSDTSYEQNIHFYCSQVYMCSFGRLMFFLHRFVSNVNFLSRIKRRKVSIYVLYKTCGLCDWGYIIHFFIIFYIFYISIAAHLHKLLLEALYPCFHSFEGFGEFLFTF